jgi:hypothetical protein
MDDYAYALADADLLLKPRNGGTEITAQITAILDIKETNR